MSHSYISCYMHYVFSTKGRQPWMMPELQERLFEYMGGIAKTHQMKSIRVGGTENHVHQLVTLPSTLTVAKAVQLIKAIPPNGSMTRSLSTATSNGRRVTVRSV